MQYRCISRVCRFLSVADAKYIRPSRTILHPCLARRSIGNDHVRYFANSTSSGYAKSYYSAVDDETRIVLEARIKEYAAKEQKEIKLHEMCRFGTGKIADEVLLKNAARVIEEIAIRLAHRLDALRSLDYLIVLNPHISEIYSLYYNSFRIMTSTKPPMNMTEHEEFVNVLMRLVESHSDTIPILARGFYECRRYFGLGDSTRILDTHLRARIGTRLIAEHHISLAHPIGPDYIGAVQLDCQPSKTLKNVAQVVGDICDMKYGIVPTITFEQGEDITLPYVPVHLDYMFMELLKNSFRAVIQNDTHEEPIAITIVRTSFGVVVRIRDRGGGIPPNIESEVFSFAFTTFDNNEGGDGFATLNTPPGGGNELAGLGYGLPLSRAYAEFFGGKLQIQSYHGWGTDVYLTLRKVDV